MSSPPSPRSRRRSGLHASCVCASVLALASCQMDNPAFDPLGGQDETGKTSGDGDGDPNTAPGDGDGDGDPSTAPGDGDGDPGDGDPSTGDGDGEPSTTDGDGDGDPIDCAPLIDCDGVCVDPTNDPDNCGRCGNVCAEQQLCFEAGCAEKRYIFVSSTLRGGFFDFGIGQADDMCNDLAQNAALPGTYAAWMSGLGQSPSEKPIDAVFVRTDEHVIATSWADLTDGMLLEPINLTEDGVLAAGSQACNVIQRGVWTATSITGTAQLPDCGGWLLNNFLLNGRVGSADAIDSNWTSSNCTASCNTTLHIYCIQQQ